jgi:AAHS family benzoate transporter-like MFS transporter
MTISRDSEREARRMRTVVWVVALATVGLIFAGYDLVVYGTVVSTFLRDPSHIGTVTPAIAGVLGSYALVGVLVGALLAGSVGDILGRRKVMLISYAWFSVGMGLTAMTTTSSMFGWLRFFTGLGVGALVATTAALVSEYAPKGKKNLINAITYGGVPMGSLLAALLAMFLLPSIGWRGLFWIGALPMVTLLPLAYFKMPESVAWLASRGRLEEARALSERTGVEIPTAEATPTGEAVPVTEGKAGYAGLFSGTYIFPTIILGLMSATVLVLVYSLNTWLPELMLRAGFNAKGSLSFLLVLNGGSLLGGLAASRAADRFGPKPVVACSFAIGAASLVLLTLGFPLAALLAIVAVVAVVGLGTSGTQTLIYGFTANYYRTNVRGAGVA